MADKAREWGVNICYSAYSARRTGCQDLFLNTAEQLRMLNEGFDQVEARRDGTNWIVNSTSTLNATREYFEHGGRPAARPGSGSWLSPADGELQPCSMQLQPLRTPGAQADDPGVHGNEHVRRMLRVDPVLPRQELPADLKENVGEYFSFSKDQDGFQAMKGQAVPSASTS